MGDITLKVSSTEDIYWEGDENNSNDFLEANDAEEFSFTGHIKRIKRGFFDWFDNTTTEKPVPQNLEKSPLDDDTTNDKDDFDNEGSGMPDRSELEPKEKTLRVTFVVMEPYQKEYSNRDSEQFQNFSKTLADAVNALFEKKLPGTQRASLVRIQSQVKDDFSCKVTLEIVTSGYEDTDRIAQTLREHIRDVRTLGTVTLSDGVDFSANVIDPSAIVSIECLDGNIQCSDGSCISGSARCDGTNDCSDGGDEEGCPNNFDMDGQEQELETVPTTQTTTIMTTPAYDSSDILNCIDYITCEGSDRRICRNQLCDGIIDCPSEEDENNCNTTEDSLIRSLADCASDELSCDETRCVPLSKRCDRVPDCTDGTDEANCPVEETCGADDFRCNDGKCIENSKKCDGVSDCSYTEDEQNCECGPEEFQCRAQKTCIEKRKVCDSINHCSDNSDEEGCACKSDQWQCDYGNCIKRSQRCDGRVDCPTDRSDERNCLANDNFRCASGKYIPGYMRCNKIYDCPPKDFSDEQNCPCRDDEYKCDNGFCINKSKHCDQTTDCQDGSDEKNCTYDNVCMAYEHKCTNGDCISAEARCNGSRECDDGSDEANCSCKRDQFKCQDGACISIGNRCDGHKNCLPNGEDEFNCGSCPLNYWYCDRGACILFSRVCNGILDCRDESAENHCSYKSTQRNQDECPANSFHCDAGSSVRCASKCDGKVECDNGEDEDNCEDCNQQCDGICLEDHLICDGHSDCSDGSDEEHCANCDGLNDYRCNNGECLHINQRCNGLEECNDGSDEFQCSQTIKPALSGCTSEQFTCADGSCINIDFHCDNKNDCYDNSDEENCPSLADTAWFMPKKQQVPMKPCHESEFTCYDGRCIPHMRRCDNIYDCTDFSDEQNCYNSDCRDDEWTCKSGQCIPSSDYCNGNPDCTDYSDETECRPPTPELTTQRPYFVPITSTQLPYYYTTPSYVRPTPAIQATTRGYNDIGRCDRNQWRCENGPCIDSNRRCDGYIDCLLDSSDEFDCPRGYPIPLKIRTYPDEQTVRYGGDVVFQCRDESLKRAPVRWIRENGRPIKAGSTDINGRLEMTRVTPSDSGVYICQAPAHLGLPGSEVRVTLSIDTAPPPSSESKRCKANEATCGNGQCIPKSALCDNKFDCSDRSDEDNCISNGRCEPNQFQCANRRCVLKSWLCDSEDDCGDGSDESNCNTQSDGLCSAVEFACADRQQCVPKNFHCDKQSDCIDGSDEIGCTSIHISKPPQPSNLVLNVGETLTLTCEAVGVPTPTVSWRLNWGHVPEKCQASDKGGYGTLTCPNMQAGDSGAYSCEAINNRGTTFAIPDAIVFVNRTDVCQSGYFNSEANTERDCIQCFCFGKSRNCKSADLFTYSMATPLGEGGTRLIGVRQTYDEIQINQAPITNEYYYVPERNGATVTKLVMPGAYPSSAHPYLSLPESYNGNQLTSYGGHIRYTVTPHSSNYGYDNSLPDIIIIGKYQTIHHYYRGEKNGPTTIEARLTPENWRKPDRRNPSQATREDIMMTLDHIEKILLRADFKAAGVNLTDFAMESAHNINVDLGVASLVEQCTCPPGYEGLSCEKCSSGYSLERSGPWLGSCVPVDQPCPAGTYGSPNSVYGCRPCPCPLTNRENQFANTCALGPRGEVICDCAPGYEGTHCERCQPGYQGNPMMHGDSCQPRQTQTCDSVGTSVIRPPDECVCKDNVQGRNCDQCKSGSFYLSSDFSHGCALCFCSGVTQSCSSSNLRRKTTSVSFNVPIIIDQVKVYTSDLIRTNQGSAYNTPVETQLRPQLIRGELGLENNAAMRSSTPSVYYWSLPVSFAGDKVTSYGGQLAYTLNNVPYQGGRVSKNNAPDVQIISDNRLTFHYYGNFNSYNDGVLNASIQLLEKGWQRPDGKEVSREHFLLALADVKTILVKATYTTNAEVASLMSASIETADNDGNGQVALHVEQCDCPVGYVGSSCEDCSPGYTRSSQGLYLYHCVPCNCNGHSNMCHPETGVCTNCMDNTDGENCELCQPGYERDAYQNCAPTASPVCRCDPRGSEGPCDQYGNCQCKQNVEGPACDRCRQGFFDLQSSNDLGCIPCYCSGVTNSCHENTYLVTIPQPAPIIGDDYGGYTIQDIDGQQIINDQFIPAINESELQYVMSEIPMHDLFWSLPNFSGNRLLSYGGNLYLTQKYENGGYPGESPQDMNVLLVGDDKTVYWVYPYPIRTGESLTYKVPIVENGWYDRDTHLPVSRQEFMGVLSSVRRVLVKATLSQDISSSAIADVSLDTAAEIALSKLPIASGIEICICPDGYSGTSCESCSSGYYKDYQGRCKKCNCNGQQCQMNNYGQVECICRPPYTGSDCSRITGESEIATSTSRPPPVSTVFVRITSPTIKIQEVGSSVNFTCQAQSTMSSRTLPVVWSKANGYLPQGRSQFDQYNGMLVITNLQISDSGIYICQTNDGVSTDQATVTLKVPGNEMTKPSIKIRTPINNVYEGDRVSLECIATGNPAPRISWQRAGNKPLPRSYDTYEKYLIINTAEVEDTGEYICTASNAAGSETSVAVVSVRQRATWPQQDKLTISPVAPSVNEGESTRVVCTGSTNVPPGAIGWIRQDGSRLLPNSRSDNGILVIDGALLENQGVYICQTSGNEATPLSVVLNVIPMGPAPPSQEPNITVSVQNITIPTGGSGTIDCNPQGIPLPLVKWAKYSGVFGPSTSQRINTLIISDAQESDGGYYMCEGTINGVPVARVYVNVDIERREAPVLQIYPQTSAEGDQFVPLNSQFEFQCRVLSGIPDPTVTWYRTSGREMTRNAQILPSNILRFENVDVNDEGEYICSASNVAGTSSASAVLRVGSRPVITIKPSDYIEAYIGHPINLECRASGYPEPMVSLRTIPDNQEVVPPTPSIATLRIPSASSDDEKHYMCVATSIAGTEQRDISIKVDSERGDYVDMGSGDPDPFPEQPSNMISIEGQDARIGCESPSNLQVQWGRRDRKPLQSNAVQRGNELIIYSTSKADIGLYECSLINNYGGIERSIYTNMQVLAAPKITLRPPTQTVRPGQSPTVECSVEGDEILAISWRPVNLPVSSRVEIRGPTLIFHQIEVEDAGQYECFASNRIANASAVAEVIVSDDEREPSVSNEHEQYSHVGVAVHLSCNVTQPDLKIRWTKDGTSIPRSVRQKADGSLYIRHAQNTDSGHYVCHIRDNYGGHSTNYINLHIEGEDCLKNEFRCKDGTGCIKEILLCDGFKDCDDFSDEGNCMLKDSKQLDSYDIFGSRVESAAYVTIDQPRRPFRVGEDLRVLCRVISNDVNATWERYGTNQYVDSNTYGDGALLNIRNLQESDAAIYRCVGRDRYGRTSYEDFNLEIIPGSNNALNPTSDNLVHTAPLRSTIDLPCTHDLEQPVTIEWSKEFNQLPPYVRTDEANLHLESVTEADAGTYICRVSNSQVTVEARAILKVEGIIPRFGGQSWISLPTIKDAYKHFDIEIAFNPADNNGILLYNDQEQDASGDYIALKLVEGVPYFYIQTGAGPIYVSGNSPLQLNTWHTVRLSWINWKVTMDIDNSGPFTLETPNNWILDMKQPLYIGGVPDNIQLPAELSDSTGFIGCVSVLTLAREEKNILLESLDSYLVENCDTCVPNQCLNEGVCQEARNQRGFICLCASGFAGAVCDRTGESCRPGLCGPGRCLEDARDGYKCSCPVPYNGRNCENQQRIEYPAFTGGAFLAIKPPNSSISFRLTMMIRADSPVTDGIIMYSAESNRGYGGFTSLAVHNRRLEFRYDVGNGNGPVILTANNNLPAHEWTDVQLSRMGSDVSMTINKADKYKGRLLGGTKKDLKLDTAMYVGGVDDSVILNNSTGVSVGFSGCIKDVIAYNNPVDIVQTAINSANVQECSNDGRGDIPEMDSICRRCRNGGYCHSEDDSACTCPAGYSGELCENRVPQNSRRPNNALRNPCSAQPCRNGGTCRPDSTTSRNYSCDCPLGHAGYNCQMPLELQQSVGFNGNGYIELPSTLIRYDENDPALMALAIYTTNDGVLLYQRESQATPGTGDYVLIKVEKGHVVLEWDLGSGPTSISVDNVFVNNGERHQIIAKIHRENYATLSVDSYSQTAQYNGLSTVMNADSNVYIGGIPDWLNVNRLPGLSGCFAQVELMYSHRGIILGKEAVAGRNMQLCRDSN